MIKGKLPNSFKESRAKFLSNPEIAGIIRIIGAGYGRDFDINKCKFDKVIAFADADADGSHICTLLLRFILLYMPGLIEAGRFYKAVPPLYGVKQGKNTMYFTSSIEYTKYIQSIFLKKFQFNDIKNRKISYNQATSIFFRNRNYVRDLEIIADTYAVDSDLLESILYELSPYIELGSSELVCNMAAKKPTVTKKKTTSKKTTTVSKSANIAIDEDSLNEDEEVIIPVTEDSVMGIRNFFIRPEFNFKTMAKNLKKKYQFIEVEKVNDIILIKGLVNSRYQYVFLNTKFISNCIDLINIIKGNDEYYLIDGNAVTIYGLMKTFESVTPNGMTRYKGLGEQNADQLKESAMDPNGARTLIRYTIESAKAEIESIRHTESNMYSLLRELKVDRSEVE